MQYNYTNIENSTWCTLLEKRKKSLSRQACSIYLEGLEKLQLPCSYVPTTDQMNRLIQQFTNWNMVPSTELVPATEYFKMLSQCEFPVITKIRPIEYIDYYASPKPDVIHEYFGHGPFLTNIDFSNFMQHLAQIALKFKAHEQLILGRLFWFTIEFGLINTVDGLRAYGAGIIPSESETQNALYGESVERREFKILDVLRTPFSALAIPNVYYIIPSFDFLYSLTFSDISKYVEQACELGSFAHQKRSNKFSLE